MENSNENAYPIKNKCKYLKVFQKEKIKEKPFQSTYNSTLLLYNEKCNRKKRALFTTVTTYDFQFH